MVVSTIGKIDGSGSSVTGSAEQPEKAPGILASEIQPRLPSAFIFDCKSIYGKVNAGAIVTPAESPRQFRSVIQSGGIQSSARDPERKISIFLAVAAGKVRSIFRS